MKNFDLEKIERKHPAKLPDHFFDDMQQKVLESTVLSDLQIPATDKSWKFKKSLYAAAACFALIIGSIFIFQDSNNALGTDQITSIQKTDVNIQNKSGLREELPAQTLMSSSNKVVDNNLIQQKSVQPQKGSEEVQSAVSKKSLAENTVKSNGLTAAKKQVKKVKAVKSSDQLDLLLESFSAEELAMIANNADKDVYLDLYN